MAKTPSDAAWASTRKVLGYINRTHGFDYTLESHFKGYSGGAWLISRRAGGEKAVLKWTSRKWWASRVLDAGPAVAVAREAGWPTPAWLAVGTTPSGYPYQIQELAPGIQTEGLNQQLVNAAIPLIESQKGLCPDTEQDWFAYDYDVIFGDQTEHFATIAAFSEKGTTFVETVRTWTAPFRDMPPCSSDLVHGDFHSGNVLLTGDQISALIDVEGLGKGSRFHDVATLIVHGVLWDGCDCDESCIQDLLSYGKQCAEPGELEISMAAKFAAMFAFIVGKHPRSADEALQKGIDLPHLNLVAWSFEEQNAELKWNGIISKLYFEDN